VTNAWEGFGRLDSTKTTMEGFGRILWSGYDSDGNRTVLGGDSGYDGHFTFDGLGRMTGAPGVFSIGYDGAGRRSGVAMGQGWTSSTIGYSYDPAGRLEKLTHTFAAAGANQAFTLTYNPAGQIASRRSANDAYAWIGSAAVDRPYAANGLNQYGSAGGATFGYDSNGNLTSTTTRKATPPTSTMRRTGWSRPRARGTRSSPTTRSAGCGR
jgi:hypothetical protein